MKTNSKYVLFDENVIHKIITELKDNPNNETGGVLLGYRNNNVWTVVEMVEPGPNAIRKIDSFEFDTEYVNQMCNQFIDDSNSNIELLGIWHKHNGKNSRFSKEDEELNKKIVILNGLDIISGIVVSYPKYSLQLYYVDLNENTTVVEHNYKDVNLM